MRVIDASRQCADDAVRGDRRTVRELDVVGRDLSGGDPDVQVHALALEHIGGVVVSCLGERVEQSAAGVDDVDAPR